MFDSILDTLLSVFHQVYDFVYGQGQTVAGWLRGLFK